jgi:hypothetical protein
METVNMSYEELDRASVVQQVVEMRLTQMAAATMLGLTSRQVRRLCRAVEEDGPAGLASKRRGRPSNRRLPGALRRRALELVRSLYEGFGPTLAHEKLTEVHGLELSVETLRHWMTEDGLWVPRARRRSRIQQPRQRRACWGELIQLDGCDHEWFEDRGSRCTALVFIDDASGSLMELLFCESESAFAYFAAMRAYLERHGRPIALYSDKAGVFRVNSKEPKGGAGVTQFARAMHSLNIDIICANTPAAKGRVERAHLTLQDRLVKEMRLRGISDMVSANAFVEEFRADYNRRFARTPRSEHGAHRPLRASDDLDRIFTWQQTRKVSKNLTVNYKRVLYLLDETDAARSARGRSINVEEQEDGAVSFWWGGQELPATAFPKEHAVRNVEVVENKRLSAAMEFIKAQQSERAEARAATKSTTLRDARLLRAGTHKGTARDEEDTRR